MILKIGRWARNPSAGKEKFLPFPKFGAGKADERVFADAGRPGDTNERPSRARAAGRILRTLSHLA